MLDQHSRGSDPDWIFFVEGQILNFVEFYFGQRRKNFEGDERHSNVIGFKVIYSVIEMTVSEPVGL